MSGNLVCLRAHDPPKRERFGDKIMRYLILGARSDAKTALHFCRSRSCPISLPCRGASYHDQAGIHVRGTQWGLAGLQAKRP
jgi:hypothetical protein